MPPAPIGEPLRPRGALHALVIVVVLAVASVAIALIGVRPERVSATEMLGDPRTPGQAAFVAAHRGGSAHAPENTLPAVAAAIDAGFDYVEVDAQLTADGVPVLMHDRKVDRTTDGQGALAALTLADVRDLDAGSWFAAEFAGTAVPTFEEFLDLVSSEGTRAMVELKGEWDAESVASLVTELTERRLERRVVLSSFDARVLGHIAAASGVVSTLAIFRSLPDDVASAATQLAVRGVVVDFDALTERPEILAELRAAGMRVVVYTLNRDRQWRDALELGVDGIVTDDPAALASWQSLAAPR